MTKHLSITTRNGDGGKTRLFSGEEVSKDAPETDACGDLDELGSVLGVARMHVTIPEIQQVLLDLQRTLFVVAAEVVTTPEHLDALGTRIDEAALRKLDKACADIETRITMPNGFVVSGGTLAGAHLDHARTVARRCERKVIGLCRVRRLDNPSLSAWMNRLSDYLWLLARLEEGSSRVMKDG